MALLLSGGVDSSLALRLLQAAGHNVTAFYLQIWFQEDFRNSWDACPWQADLEVANRVGILLLLTCRASVSALQGMSSNSILAWQLPPKETVCQCSYRCHALPSSSDGNCGSP